MTTALWLAILPTIMATAMLTIGGITYAIARAIAETIALIRSIVDPPWNDHERDTRREIRHWTCVAIAGLASSLVTLGTIARGLMK